MRWLLLGAGVTCAAISFGLYLLVHRGMLASMVRILVRARLVSEARYLRWHPKLAGMHNRLLAGNDPEADADVVVEQVMNALERSARD